jgi:hypothetical protein
MATEHAAIKLPEVSHTVLDKLSDSIKFHFQTDNLYLCAEILSACTDDLLTLMPVYFAADVRCLCTCIASSLVGVNTRA